MPFIHTCSVIGPSLHIYNVFPLAPRHWPLGRHSTVCRWLRLLCTASLHSQSIVVFKTTSSTACENTNRGALTRSSNMQLHMFKTWRIEIEMMLSHQKICFQCQNIRVTKLKIRLLKKFSYQFLFADGDFPRQTVGLLELTII